MLASRLALVLGLVAATLPLQSVQAGNRQGFHTEDYCDTPWVIDYLKTVIGGKDRPYDGDRLRQSKIINPTLTYERKRDNYHNVGRKFCHAKVKMVSGEVRDMWYIVKTPDGFAGPPALGGIEYCIAGLDPWHVYGKDCSTVRNAIGW